MHVAFFDMDFPSIKSHSFLWSWENVTKAREFLDVHTEDANRHLIETSFADFEAILGDLKRMKRGKQFESNIILLKGNFSASRQRLDS